MNIRWQTDVSVSRAYRERCRAIGIAPHTEASHDRDRGDRVAMENGSPINDAKDQTHRSLWFDFRRKDLTSVNDPNAALSGDDLEQKKQLELRVASLRDFWSVRGPGLAWLWSKQFPEFPNFDVEIFSVLPEQGGGGGWFSPSQLWFEAVLHDSDDRLPELVRMLFLVVGCGWWQRAKACERFGLIPAEASKGELSDAAELQPPWPGFIEQTFVLTCRFAEQVEWVASHIDTILLATQLWRLNEYPAYVALGKNSHWEPFEKWLDIRQSLDAQSLYQTSNELLPRKGEAGR